VVTACAKDAGSSAIVGSLSLRAGEVRGENLSHIPDCLFDADKVGGAETGCSTHSSGKSSMRVKASRDDIRGGTFADAD
jgi:hypothetical protein